MQSGEANDLKQTDAASYDSVAATFDQLSERYSKPAVERLLALADIRTNDRILDLGSGTGLVALRAAAAAEKGHTMGVDHSEGMLAQARHKAEASGLRKRTEFVKMDAEALTFPDATFDVAVSLYVLLHLPDPLAALRELHRVVRPGGRVVIGVGRRATLWSRSGRSQALGRLKEFIAITRGPVLTAPDFIRSLMYEMGLKADHLEYMPHHGKIDTPSLLREAGFRGVRSDWAGATFSLTPEEFWDVSAVYGSAERVRIAELLPAEAERLRAAFLEKSREALSRNGRLLYRCGARIYVAYR